MKFCSLCILGPTMMLITIGNAHAKSWKGIVPLHSTRHAVEKLLGTPTASDRGRYDFQTELVSIDYSRGPCIKGWPYGWNSPADTVTAIRVVPKVALSLSSLNIDLSSYRKEKESDMPTHIVYINDPEGTSIEFDEPEGWVQAVNYFPPIEEKRLLCPGAATLERDAARAQKYRIGSYSPSDVEDEKSSLDHLATELLKLGPKWRGYLFAYAGPKATRNEAQNIAARARKYLAQKAN